jgi:hypothetical protein
MANSVKIPPEFVTMFDEAQKQLNRQFNSFASLRKYAETIMGISSAIVSLFATFKVFDTTVVKPNTFYFLFMLIAILYTILMILCITVATPSYIESPIKADLANYIEAYGNKNEKEIIASQIAIYIRAIKINEKNLVWRAWFSKIIGSYLCTVVVLILLAASSILVQ